MTLYFHPQTVEIQRLRQCLSYFFASYSRSTYMHQKLISMVCFSLCKVFYKSISALIDVQSEIGGTMLSLVKIATQLVDWTNISQLVDSKSKNGARNLHSPLVIEGLEKALSETVTFRKLVCQLLSKFNVEINAFNRDEIGEKVAALKAVTNDEAVCKKALDKFMERVTLDENEVLEMTAGVANIDLE